MNDLLARRPRLIRRLCLAGLASSLFGVPASRAADLAVPPVAAPTVPTPGWRTGAGQAPVVAGNVAGARERALGEALKQAVDQALGAVLDPARRAAEARTANLVLSRARSYVTRYRTLEDAEAGAVYRVRLEAEVDENALERAFVPASSAAMTGKASTAAGFLVVAADPDQESTLVAAVRKQGLRAEPAASPAPANPPEAATKANLLAVVFVQATSSDDGVIRGAGVWSSACHVRARVVSAPAGDVLGEPEVDEHGFGPNVTLARHACLAAAGDSLVSLLAQWGESASSASGVRPLIVEVSTTSPAALPLLVRTFRAMAAVSGADLRHVSGGRADLWVRTTLPPRALLAALGRDRQSGLQITEVPGAEAADRLRIGVQVAEPNGSLPANETGTNPGAPPAPSSSPGATGAPGGATP